MKAHDKTLLYSVWDGKSKKLVLASICMTVIFFFYIFTLGSALQPKVYSFHGRVTYEKVFDIHTGPLEFDVIILLVASISWSYLSIVRPIEKSILLILFSILFFGLLVNNGLVTIVAGALTLPILGFVCLFDNFTNKKFLRQDYRLTLGYISIVAILIASLGILGIFWSLVDGTTTAFEWIPYSLFQEILSLQAPALMAGLIFGLPLKVLSLGLIRQVNGLKEKLLTDIVEIRLRRRQVIFYLSICLIFSVVLAVVPHIPITNPNHERLGVDSLTYVKGLGLMKNQSEDPIYLALAKLSGGDRPLTFILLFLVSTATGADPFQTVESSPIYLAPLLVLVTFFLTREITGNDKISLLSAFLTSISFQTLVGIYSGFYANWFALIFGYLALGICIRYLKRPSKLNIVILAVVMTAVLLGHLYTWTIIISIAFVFLAVLYAVNYYPRKHIIILYLVLSSSIAVDVLKSLMTDSYTGLTADISLGRHGLGPSQFSDHLRTLADTIQTYYGGIYANIIILGLGMYWLIRCNPRNLSSIFLLVFVSSALVPLFIGDWVLQSRVLYEIPFQIPAAIALFLISKDNHKVIGIAIILVAFYLSFHVLVNLGYVPARNPLSLNEITR